MIYIPLWIRSCEAVALGLKDMVLLTSSKEEESTGSRRQFQRGGAWGSVEYSILLGGVITLLATGLLVQNYGLVWSIWRGEFSVNPRTAWRSNFVRITRLYRAVNWGAVCLDGSPPAYYLDRGFGEGARNWLVHFEGGGWCTTDEDCHNRAFTELGSSRYMPNVISLEGILSPNPAVNPDFYNWNRVRFKYCDGGSFFGDVDQAVSVKHSLNNRSSERPSTVYYRGMRVWKAVMEDLLSKGMIHAKKGFLTGCSAGGLATFLHCDGFKEVMPKNSVVKCLSDAGFFLHIPDIAGAPTIESMYRDVVNLQNIAQNLPKECTSSRDPAQCFFPTYLIQLTKTPFFALNPGYDSWQFHNVLIPDNADPKDEWNDCKNNLFLCTGYQMKIVQGFRTELLKQLGSLLDNPNGGAFINSCYGHCQVEQDWIWSGESGPKIKGKSVRQAVGEWYNDKKAHILVDCPFPCNPTCG